MKKDRPAWRAAVRRLRNRMGPSAWKKLEWKERSKRLTIDLLDAMKGLPRRKHK